MHGVQNEHLGWDPLQVCTRTYPFRLSNNVTHQLLISRAWSSIVYMLIPNVKALENSLYQFANIVDADEVLLFERATFLVISHCQRKPHKDGHRFEKVSNIIKQFKLSCSKLAAQFQSMEVTVLCLQQRWTKFIIYMFVFRFGTAPLQRSSTVSLVTRTWW